MWRKDNSILDFGVLHGIVSNITLQTNAIKNNSKKNLNACIPLIKSISLPIVA